MESLKCNFIIKFRISIINTTFFVCFCHLSDLYIILISYIFKAVHFHIHDRSFFIYKCKINLQLPVRIRPNVI